MATPISSPIPDPIDQLSQLIDIYHEYSTSNPVIQELTGELLGQIERDEPFSKRLLARLNITICPKIKGKFGSIADGEKSETVACLDALFKGTLQKSRERSLLEETTHRFLSGELQTEEDIPLIVYMIENSPKESGLYSPPELFIHHLSIQTADEAIGSLLRKNPQFFQAHLALIVDKLTSLGAINLDTRPNHTKFLEALSEASDEIKVQIKARCHAIWAQYDCFEIQRKSGEIWKCTGREKDPKGVGYLYTFQMKPEYMDVSEFLSKREEIFPAIEAHIDVIRNEFLEAVLKEYILRFQKGLSEGQDIPIETRTYIENEIKGYQKKIVDLRLFQKLGFCFNKSDTTLVFPDRNALMHRYNQLRLTPEYSHLPPLSIISGFGIASDLDFIRANIDHDGIISEGKEFFHDQMSHIISLLGRANLGSEKFGEIKTKMMENYSLYLEKIKTSKKVFGENSLIFETLLGAYVDVMSNVINGTPGTLEMMLSDKTQEEFAWCLELLAHSGWKLYLSNRYNDSKKGPIFDEFRIRALLSRTEKLPE